MNLNAPVFVLRVNNDLNEGKSCDVTLAICETEATARRIGRKKNVQGTDAKIIQVVPFEYKGEFYIPLRYVRIETPSLDDITAQQRIDRYNELKAKAISFGMTENELDELKHL